MTSQYNIFFFVPWNNGTHPLHRYFTGIFCRIAYRNKTAADHGQPGVGCLVLPDLY